MAEAELSFPFLESSGASKSEGGTRSSGMLSSQYLGGGGGRGEVVRESEKLYSHGKQLKIIYYT